MCIFMNKKFTLFFTATALLLLLVGCGKENESDNSSFETGTLENWILEGDEDFVELKSDIYFGDEIRYYQDGLYHIITKDELQGTLSLENITIEGMGYITFLIMGNPDNDNVFVEIIDEETDEVLFVETNTKYNGEDFTDNYIRVIIDASDYIGSSFTLKITDNSSTGYIGFDGLDANIETEEELLFYQQNLLARSGIMTEDLVDSANHYINLNKSNIDDSYRYTFHVMGEIGWINDPNGFVQFNEEYHLFYQHNPYSALWGPMHWGHVTSDDLVKWEYQPIAVAPIVFDAGGGAAFSGSAIEVDNELYIMYTENWMGYQDQVIAKSTDGIHFEKINSGNAVIDADDLPWYANPVDFRDPKIWEADGVYYSVIGSRQINDYGQVLLFKSENLLDWEFVGPVIQGSQSTKGKLGYMFECPDVFELNGKDVLIMSPQQITSHRNDHGTVFVVGDLNYETGILENWQYEDIKEIDYGFDFYAPQTMIDSNGRRIMVAWMQSWNRSPLTTGLGWAGAMTFPRELTLDEDNNLIQYPIQELMNYRQNEFNFKENVLESTVLEKQSNTADIEVTFTPNNGKTGITLLSNDANQGVEVYYENGHIVLDRSAVMGGRFPGEENHITSVPVDLKEDGTISLRILLDKHSVEVFVNDGKYAITSTVVYHPNNQGIVLYSENELIMDVNIWDIVVE
jgi:beta-fructofuranosidase